MLNIYLHLQFFETIVSSMFQDLSSRLSNYIKLIELLLKPREKNISINDIGTSEEIKTSLKIISEGIEKFPEIMNKLSEITKNIQNDQRNFINNLLIIGAG